MAAHGALRLRRMNDNLAVILAVEALCAAQGVEHREPLKTSPALSAAIAALREKAPRLGGDRLMAPLMEASRDVISSGALVKAAGLVFEVERAAQ